MLSKEKLIDSLNKLRPYLQEDGGDIELVEIREDGIILVKFSGTCQECPLSTMTLRAGIERALLNEFPTIRRIEAVN